MVKLLGCATSHMPHPCTHGPCSLQELIEKCLDNDPRKRPSFHNISEALRRLAQEEAAGQLVYALAVPPPEKRGAKLFRMESKKEREERKLVTASLPSQV